MNARSPATNGLLLWDTFEYAARAHADAPAFVDGTEIVTYDELRARVDACTHRLRELDRVRRALDRGGAVIGLVAVEPRSTITWILAALGVGASVAPISPNASDRDDQIRLLQPDVAVLFNKTEILEEP